MDKFDFKKMDNEEFYDIVTSAIMTLLLIAAICVFVC